MKNRDFRMFLLISPYKNSDFFQTDFSGGHLNVNIYTIFTLNTVEVKITSLES